MKHVTLFRDDKILRPTISNAEAELPLLYFGSFQLAGSNSRELKASAA